MNFEKYHKVNSLYQRDEKTKKFISAYSCPEFFNIQFWTAYEKIDGTNIRIMYTPKTDEAEAEIYIGGKTDDAQIPAVLYDFLKKKFPLELLEEEFKENPCILYGEGFGQKIQQGSYYRESVGFILFDIKVGKWWLERNNQEDIAKKFDIPIVPHIMTASIKEIENFLLEKPKSKIAQYEHQMEGLVCRPEPYLFNRRGEMIIFKLKIKDLMRGKIND